MKHNFCSYLRRVVFDITSKFWCPRLIDLTSIHRIHYSADKKDQSIPVIYHRTYSLVYLKKKKINKNVKFGYVQKYKKKKKFTKFKYLIRFQKWESYFLLWIQLNVVKNICYIEDALSMPKASQCHHRLHVTSNQLLFLSLSLSFSPLYIISSTYFSWNMKMN